MQSKEQKYFNEGLNNAAKDDWFYAQQLARIEDAKAIERSKNGVARYRPTPEPQPEYPPVGVMIQRAARPVIALVSLATACGVIISIGFGFASATIAAISTWMAANTGIVALGAALSVAAALTWSAITSGTHDKDTTTGKTGETHNHYTINNYQGPNQNNNTNNR